LTSTQKLVDEDFACNFIMVHFTCNVLATGTYFNFLASNIMVDFVAIQNHWIHTGIGI
jgi:hypothetical protein